MLLDWINNIATSLNLSNTFTIIVTTFLKIALFLLVSLIIYALLKFIFEILMHLMKKPSHKTVLKRAKQRYFVLKLTLFDSFIFINNMSYIFPSAYNVISKITTIIVLILLMVMVDCVLNVVCDIYNLRSISRRRPIKGGIQIAKILIFMIISLIIISLLIDQSPLILIGGIGTFTAILSIVFKDALLGLVAGVQITSDDLLRIGDWIEIPSQQVEGTVQDISLITVKILAFDNTLLTVPAYTFLSVPFRNWHTAIKGKARRVKRTIYIDVNSLKALSDTEIDSLVKDYSSVDGISEAISKMRTEGISVTNLAMYRELIVHSLRCDRNICKDKLIICQIDDSMTSKGIPVDFFFFTTLTGWEEHSKIAAEKMEFALLLARKLELNVYQERCDRPQIQA